MLCGNMFARSSSISTQNLGTFGRTVFEIQNKGELRLFGCHKLGYIARQRRWRMT